MVFSNVKDMVDAALADCAETGECIGWSGTLKDMSNNIYETELFPADVLKKYFAFNMRSVMDIDLIAGAPDLEGKPIERVEQGWYGDSFSSPLHGMLNVVEILTDDPLSKRAVLHVTHGSHSDLPSRNRCLMQLVFSLRDNKLNCVAFMRSNHTGVMPKNIFVNTTLTSLIASTLGVEVGSYTHSVALMFSRDSKPNTGVY